MSLRAKPPSLKAARAEATLGLPLPRDSRFRFLKRVVYRLSWPVMSHQVAYNEHVIDAFNQALDEVARHFDELTTALSEKLELGLHQASREIGDHVARTESAIATLQIQIAELRRRSTPGGGDAQSRPAEPQEQEPPQ